ncbi:MAG: class I SAM-dependent methyltransferase [Acidobacteria bacterium]|nr:MAG: class I SAM-dependent methyltransferase [Acidobacteriota bacterium]
MISEELFNAWYAALEQRHLKALTFQEVRHALQALSSLYVERRQQSGAGKALDSAGKRAAFSLFYAALHLLEVSYVADQLNLKDFPIDSLTDLGCGTGTGGIAWSLELGGSVPLTAVDQNTWVLEEARWNFRQLGVKGEARQADLARCSLPPSGGVLLAFTVNELDEAARGTLLQRLRRRRGQGLLIVEPIARRVSPWWDKWAEIFQKEGGKEDQWRFTPPMPERLRLLDKAAGLDHRELTCRSLWVAPACQGVTSEH